MKIRIFLALAVVVTVGAGLIWLFNANSVGFRVERVRFGDLPDAMDKFQFLTGSAVWLVDASKDHNLLAGPPLVMVGVKIVVCSKQYYFTVAPTRPGQEVPMRLYRPGEKVDVEKNDEYTVLIFENNQMPLKPIGKSAFVKSDEKSLKRLIEEMNTKLQDREPNPPTKELI